MDLIINYFSEILQTNGPRWIIGQGFGIVAIVLGFISYQLKTRRQLIYMQSAVAVVFCIHYFLIGAYPAMAMNFVNIIRNFAYDYRTEKGIQSKIIPIAFVIIQAIMCAITWTGWYSVFVLLGIGINTYCMSSSDAQFIRKSVLVTSPLVLTYDIFARSIGGSIYESVALISAAIGVVRYFKAKRNNISEEVNV